MKKGNQYLKFVYWSDEDQAYVGLCPDLFYGGCHGDDELAVYAELCEIVEEWVELAERNNEDLPPVRLTADKIELFVKNMEQQAA